MMTISTAVAEQLAARLHDALASRTPIARLENEHPQLTEDDAYAIQHALRRLQLKDGTRLAGKKTGFTSREKQVQMGVDSPIAGYLLASNVLGDDQPLDTSAMIHPKAEPEIAFILGDRLRGPGVTPAHVLAATRYVAPAFEILDSRYESFKFGLADVIADNTSAGRVVLGSNVLNPDGVDLRLIGMVLEKNGQVIATGAGAAVLDHPAAAVAWLVNKLAEWDEALQPGEIVMPGALSASYDIRPGDHFRASFDRLGAVSARCGS